MVLSGFRCAGPALGGLISRLGLWWRGLAGELDGDGFEFGDELAQVAVGVEGKCASPYCQARVRYGRSRPLRLVTIALPSRGTARGTGRRIIPAQRVLSVQ